MVNYNFKWTNVAKHFEIPLAVMTQRITHKDIAMYYKIKKTSVSSHTSAGPY